MNKFRLSNFLWLGLALLVVAIDQFTKNLVLTHLHLYEAIKITPFFNILLSFNTGAAFNFLSDASGWQQWFFGAIAIAVSIILIFILLRQPRNQILTSLSFSFILGGAIGNLIDRLTHGFVVDFLHFHIGEWSWPIFNFADTMICIGAGLLLLSIFLQSK